METIIEGICSVLFWQNNATLKASKRAHGFEKDHLALKSDAIILRKERFRFLKN